MKTQAVFSCLLLTVSQAFGQVGVREIGQETFKNLLHKSATTSSETTAAAASDDPPITNKVNKGLDFGASLGFSRTFDKVYEARISPLDNKLKITTAAQPAFLTIHGPNFSPVQRRLEA